MSVVSACHQLQSNDYRILHRTGCQQPQQRIAEWAQTKQQCCSSAEDAKAERWALAAAIAAGITLLFFLLVHRRMQNSPLSFVASRISMLLCDSKYRSSCDFWASEGVASVEAYLDLIWAKGFMASWSAAALDEKVSDCDLLGDLVGDLPLRLLFLSIQASLDFTSLLNIACQFHKQQKVKNPNQKHYEA